MSGREFYERATLLLSGVLVALGLAQIVVAAARGSGSGAYLVGVLLVLVGGARIWLAAQRRREG